MRGYSNDYNINVKTVGDFMGVMISLTSRKIGRLNKNCVWCVCVMNDVCIVDGFSGERRLGDLEVALTLEDLGLIVQPTVQLEAAEKKGVSQSSYQFEEVYEMLLINY